MKAATMSNLPEDLVEEILCRLPATSLKRLRFTCKRWNRLYKDSRFARKHFDKAAKQFVPLMLTKDYRLCSLSISLQGTPSVEVGSELSQLCSAQRIYIEQVFHCDGLLLCITTDKITIVVWNPLTGETRWIQAGITMSRKFALGYYQDNKSCNKRYKILSHSQRSNVSEIYDFKSDSWRIIDNIKPNLSFLRTGCSVSLKGDIYWFARDLTDKSMTLLRFDFSAEKFERVSLPSPLLITDTRILSVVREEKVSVLLKLRNASKTEVWVTNKIDETKMVSWSKILELDWSPDLPISSFGSFLLDEEKKVIVCRNIVMDFKNSEMVYIIGEDNKVTKLDFGVAKLDSCWSFIFYYVPSLVQIQSGGGKTKRKRCLLDKLRATF